jgi:hypothetical protein
MKDSLGFKPDFLLISEPSYPSPHPLPGPEVFRLPIYPHRSRTTHATIATPSPQKRHRLVKMSAPGELKSITPSIPQDAEEDEDEDETTGGRCFSRCPEEDLSAVVVVAAHQLSIDAILSPAGWARKGVHSRA